MQKTIFYRLTGIMAFDAVFITTVLTTLLVFSNTVIANEVSKLSHSDSIPEVLTLPAITVTSEAVTATTEGTGSWTTGETAAATRLPLSLRETPQLVTVVTRQRIGLNKLGDHNIRALLFAKLAKDDVGKPRHRREIQWELPVLKPRKHEEIELCVKNRE